ncbi:MAG: T9SS type A sorting domain-containing protein [Bacteroidota bacterium]
MKSNLFFRALRNTLRFLKREKLLFTGKGMVSHRSIPLDQFLRQLCVFSLLLVIYTIPVGGQDLLKVNEQGDVVPICDPRTSPFDCLRNIANDSEVIFEGTVLSSNFFEARDEKWFIKVTYLVHKVFKESPYNIPDTIYTFIATRTPDDVRDGKLYYNNLKENEPIALAPKTGKTGIIYLNTNYDYASLFEEVPFEVNVFLLYHLVQDEPEDVLGKDEIMFVRTPSKSVFDQASYIRLGFSNVQDIYNMISLDTKDKFIDKTRKRFKKKVSTTRNFLAPSIIFYTERVPAGSGEKLIIQGSNLGSQNVSHIRLEYNAVASLITHLIIDKNALPEGYIQTWTNDKIEIELPSVIAYSRRIGQTSYYFPATALPISGQIRVGKKILGDEEYTYTPLSNDYFLNIPYTLENKAIGLSINEDDGNSVEVEKVRKLKFSPNSSDGVIEFEVQPELRDNTTVWNLILEAMNEWTCRIGVAWKIKSEDEGIAGSFTEGDGINSISLKDANLGRTTETSCSGNDNYEVINELDVFLNTSSINTSSSEKIYNIILHELGHTLGLQHTLPEPNGVYDLMTPGPDKVALGILPGISNDDLEGVSAMKTLGTTDWICNSAANFDATRAMGEFSVDITQSSGANQADASVDLTIEDLGDAYTVQWSNGATSEDLTNVVGGEYTVTVTFGGGQCQEVIDVDVSTCPEITVSGQFNAIDPSGCGQMDGNIYARFTSASGGQSPYTMHWENEQGEIIPAHEMNDLPSGEYCRVATDANGCQGRKCVSIQSPGDPQVVPYVILPDCDGQGNGYIYLEAYNSANLGLNYDFHWNFGTTYINVNTVELDNLEAGDYSVTITPTIAMDPPCEITYEFTIEPFDSEPVEVFSDIVHPCPDDNNGSIALTISEGYGEYYDVSWNDNPSLNTLHRNHLPKGTYTVTITDHCGWVIEETFVLEPISTSLTKYPGCKDEGEIFVEATGGNQPYTYLWSNGRSSQFESNLPRGYYTVRVFDHQNCLSEETATLINKEYVLNETKPCEGIQNGKLKLHIYNPESDNVDLFFENIEIETGAPQMLTTFNFDNLIDRNYSLQVSVGECIYNETIQLDADNTDKVFSHAENGICFYDDVCQGEVIGENTYQEPVYYDQHLAYGDIWGGCSLPGFCSTFPDRTRVDTWSFDIRKVKGFEYWMILQAAEAGGEVSYDDLQELRQYYINQGIRHCEVVRYCPATLKIIATLDALFNDVDGIHQLEDDCWRIDCVAPSKDRVFCISGSVPPYFESSVDYSSINPDIEVCDIRQYPIYQLILWLADLNNLPGFPNSQLANFLGEVIADPIKSEKAKCIQVKFCRNNFSLPEPVDFTVFDCDAHPAYCTLSYDTGDPTKVYTDCYFEFINPRFFDQEDDNTSPIPTVFTTQFPGPDLFLQDNGAESDLLQFLPDNFESTYFSRFGQVSGDQTKIPKGIFRTGDHQGKYFNDFTHSAIYQSLSGAPGLEHFYDDFDKDRSIYILEGATNNQLSVVYRDPLVEWNHNMSSSGLVEIKELNVVGRNIHLGVLYTGTLSYEGTIIAESSETAAAIVEISDAGNLLDVNTINNIFFGDFSRFIKCSTGITFLGRYANDNVKVNDTVRPMVKPQGQVQVLKDEGGTIKVVETVSFSSGLEVLDAHTNGIINAYITQGAGTVRSNAGIVHYNFHQEVTLLLMDADNNLLWKKPIAVGNDLLSSEVNLLQEKEITYAAITFSGVFEIDELTFNSEGGKDILILAFDHLGNIVGHQHYGSPSSEVVKEIFVNKQGNIYIGGDVMGNTLRRQIGAFHFIKRSPNIINSFISYIEGEDLIGNTSALQENEEDNIRNTIGRVNEQSMLEVFPNPFTQEVNISIQIPEHLLGDNIFVNVTDILGHNIFEEEVDSSQEYQVVTITESLEWPSGIYLVNLQSSDRLTLSTIKIIKK